MSPLNYFYHLKSDNTTQHIKSDLRKIHHQLKLKIQTIDLIKKIKTSFYNLY